MTEFTKLLRRFELHEFSFYKFIPDSGLISRLKLAHQLTYILRRKEFLFFGMTLVFMIKMMPHRFFEERFKVKGYLLIVIILVRDFFILSLKNLSSARKDISAFFD